MFILSFYLFLFGYAALLLWLFPVGWLDFADPLWYVFIALSLLIGFIVSFATQLLILKIVGELRKNKGMKNMFNHRFANSLLKLGLHLARVKVIVTGRENIPNKNFILVSNHQENYDILILKPIFQNHPLSFIAKEALRKLPIFGPWIDYLGNVFISRDADRSAAESIIKGIRNYKDGMSMGIFPEGKRSFGNDMIEFKAGAFKLAMKPKADLLIATQYDTCAIFKRFPWRRYKVYVHVHPIIPYERYKDMNSHELSDFVKAEIQAQLDRFTTQYN